MTWNSSDRGSTRKGERYDYEHQKERNRRKRTHHPTDPCTRCGHELGPMSSSLHLDLTDDGMEYLGFAHGWKPCEVCGQKCNIDAGSAKGSAIAHGTETGRSATPGVPRFTQSRRWLP